MSQLAVVMLALFGEWNAPTRSNAQPTHTPLLPPKVPNIGDGSCMLLQTKRPLVQPTSEPTRGLTP